MEKNTDIITAEVVDAAYELHKRLAPGCSNPSTSVCWHRS